ncbi:MAG: transposase, partial [Treponema sp.]|nr:transposase [Treponema sp.]
EQLGINLVFIPPYSPNRNLIERFWKLVKGKLRSRYYDQFKLFREQIDSIIDSADNLTKRL